MPRRAKGNGSDGIYDPNLTPLIDVSLVLVVILLVTTPLALQSGIGVSRAAASGRSGPVAPAARVEIELREDGHIIVNREDVPFESLAGVLRQHIAESPTRDVVVRCGDGVTHGTFVRVIDEAKAQGAAHIAVAGR